MPLLKAALSLNSRMAEVEVKLVPERVNAPVMVIFADPPEKFPPLNVAVVDTAMVFVPWPIVPVNPAATVKLLILTVASIVQLPMPLLSKLTSSAAPGTLEPPGPPELADQLAILFQLDGLDATQKRAAIEFFERLIHITSNRQEAALFMGLVYIKIFYYIFRRKLSLLQGYIKYYFNFLRVFI